MITLRLPQVIHIVSVSRPLNYSRSQRKVTANKYKIFIWINAQICRLHATKREIMTPYVFGIASAKDERHWMVWIRACQWLVGWWGNVTPRQRVIDICWTLTWRVNETVGSWSALSKGHYFAAWNAHSCHCWILEMMTGTLLMTYFQEDFDFLSIHFRGSTSSQWLFGLSPYWSGCSVFK